MEQYFGASMIGQWAAFLLLGALAISGAIGCWWLGVKMNQQDWAGDYPRAMRQGSRGREGVGLMGFIALACSLFVLFGWIPWGVWIVKRSFGLE